MAKNTNKNKKDETVQEEEILNYSDIEEEVFMGKDEELVSDPEEVNSDDVEESVLVIFNINVKYGDDLIKIGETYKLPKAEAIDLSNKEIVKIV